MFPFLLCTKDCFITEPLWRSCKWTDPALLLPKPGLTEFIPKLLSRFAADFQEQANLSLSNRIDPKPEVPRLSCASQKSKGAVGTSPIS